MSTSQKKVAGWISIAIGVGFAVLACKMALDSRHRASVLIGQLEQEDKVADANVRSLNLQLESKLAEIAVEDAVRFAYDPTAAVNQLNIAISESTVRTPIEFSAMCAYPKHPTVPKYSCFVIHGQLPDLRAYRAAVERHISELLNARQEIVDQQTQASVKGLTKESVDLMADRQKCARAGFSKGTCGVK